MSQRLFITSTGTEQGKTFASCTLLQQLRESGVAAKVLKPVISGYVEGDGASDTAQLLRANGQEVTAQTIAACSPWRYAVPLSPDEAAAQEGKAIDFAQLTDFCQQNADTPTLIEGAGGLMSPLTRQHTNLDLILALHCPVVLVSSIYLGCISHILTALEVLRSRKVVVKGLILSEAMPAEPSAEVVFASLKPQLPTSLAFFHLPHQKISAGSWQGLPNLIKVCPWH